MPTPTPPDPWPLPELQRARRAIVVVDVVESVRLMQEDESGFIDRWRRFVNEVRTQVLPAHGGRLVKSLGDGMLLEFASVPPAVAAVLVMKQLACVRNGDAASTDGIAPSCRFGIHIADIATDDLDIYGSGVNLAARIASLAQPNEIVVSPEARDELLADWDAEIEDLGECWVKHLDTPQRAYRIGPASARSEAEKINSVTVAAYTRPSIAVAPFTSVNTDPASAAIGDVLADDLIAALSVNGEWHVISRLSCHAMRFRSASLADWSSHTGATFVLSGQCVVCGPSIRVTVELADVRDGGVIWAEVYRATISALFQGDDGMRDNIVGNVARAVSANQLDRARHMALPALDSYALLLHGISCMHRTSPLDEDRARGALTHLIERHPRAPEPRAWMAKWHVLRVAQARTEDPLTEAGHARAFVSPALDMCPDHALSLAIDGLVHAFIERDLDTAQSRYEEALRHDPNESLAWLYLSAVHAHRGAGEDAVRCCAQAQRLSPLDPLGYYYDGFAAWAALAAGQYGRALALAMRSMRGNRLHLPTHILLTQALALSGDIDRARISARALLALRPSMSTARYFENFPGGPNEHAQRLAGALRIAGVPN